MQDEVKVREIETVAGDFLTEAGVPFYRVEIDGFCADFDYREAAENFANAINQMVARHRHQAEREEEEAHKIGISEGRQEMVREIDLATGGDGEFRWSTEPDRHCPCEEAMKARVIERFHQAERETLARMEPVYFVPTFQGHDFYRFPPQKTKPDKIHEGWSYVPLYALPPAPEAGQ